MGARLGKTDYVPGFTTHTGNIAVVAEDNIDTDRIIPARYLTRINRSGYGELLFHDVRGPSFPLDRAEAANASILVVGSNFGCGSSREHAVWAIQQGGFRAVLSRSEFNKPGFADIFRQNSANCGLLLIELEPEAHRKLVELKSGAEATIDLPNQTVSAQNFRTGFEINPAVKDAVLQGLDLIVTTLLLESKIEKYERAHEFFVGKDMVSLG
jgi:3-isopropylmalate/(R)-2-methylmalate dehydratase small subunit